MMGILASIRNLEIGFIFQQFHLYRNWRPQEMSCCQFICVRALMPKKDAIAPVAQRRLRKIAQLITQIICLAVNNNE